MSWPTPSEILLTVPACFLGPVLDHDGTTTTCAARLDHDHPYRTEEARWACWRWS